MSSGQDLTMNTDEVNVWAVIPAAGIGKRMRTAIPKQYLEISGKTILEHSVQALLQTPTVKKLVICLSPQDRHFANLTIRDARVTSTEGGNERADSVLKGLLALREYAKDDDWVLVHDAARPCLGVDQLQAMLEQLMGDSVGGILATPARDTLKMARHTNGNALVEETLDRSKIWHAQTPQMFRYGLLKAALQSGLKNGLSITDEASAMEFAGHSVKLVEGSFENLKVTSPEDQKLAEFILTQR